MSTDHETSLPYFRCPVCGERDDAPASVSEGTKGPLCMGRVWDEGDNGHNIVPMDLVADRV